MTKDTAAYLESIGANELMGFGKYRDQTIVWVYVNHGPRGHDFGRSYVQYMIDEFECPNPCQAHALHVFELLSRSMLGKRGRKSAALLHYY